MSRRPSAHVYLRDEFLYYSRRRLFLRGGASVKLERADWAILECLERGESELGVLAHSLAELEIGGDPLALAERLMGEYMGPRSVLAAGAPLDVVEPDVIVCSFSPDLRHVDVGALVKRLRRRFEVLHVGLEKHVTGDPRANRTYESSASELATPFRFVQWARSFARFSTESALVLSGVQDKILFGDLAAKQHSLAFAEPDWPGPTGLQDVLGSKALLRDPLASLQAMFFALRMTALHEFDRLTAANSSELAALALYCNREASDVAYTVADQPGELERLGRDPAACAPASLAPPRFPAARTGSGTLAVVLDAEYFGQAGAVFGALHRTLPEAGLERIVLRTQHGWFDLRADARGVSMVQRPQDTPTPRLAAAVIVPGLCRHLVPILDTLREGVPTILYPTQHEHPLLAGAAEGWFARASTAPEWAQLLVELKTPGTPLHATARGEAQRVLRRFDVAERVARLVELARREPGAS